jgi:hypothetical protein
MSKLVEKYDMLLNDSNVYKFKPIRAFVPNPTDADYNVGYIVRYFAQKVNDRVSPVIEISEDTSRELDNNNYYNVVSLRWRIRGPLQPIYKKNGEIADKGVMESNRISIKLASADNVPNLKNYLGNLMQFYKK